MNHNITANYTHYKLHFKQPSGTSRGVLHHKDTYFIHLKSNQKQSIGECNLFKGLGADDLPDYEQQLQTTCNQIHLGLEKLLRLNQQYPSIQFGLEQAFLGLENQCNQVLFPSEFTKGKDSILINGLIWMGDLDFMRKQIKQKLNENFGCLKLKIGVNWAEEYKLLKQLRQEFTANELELRVDANGAFLFNQAKVVLQQLAELNVHSIEQPIKQGNWQHMAQLCQDTPTPIALDEELIGICSKSKRQLLLQTIKPQYMILKPALVGGFASCKQWIELAKHYHANWWITSALESNVGLNAIAQFTYTLQNPMPQGLGTGGLFTNNLPSGLVLKGDQLWFKGKEYDS